MHIAYSALRTISKKGKPALADKQLQQRLNGYHAACQKHQQEILAIQKYLPGWLPEFKAV